MTARTVKQFCLDVLNRLDVLKRRYVYMVGLHSVPHGEPIIRFFISLPKAEEFASAMPGAKIKRLDATEEQIRLIQSSWSNV